jgi:hypothetical protein
MLRKMNRIGFIIITILLFTNICNGSVYASTIIEFKDPNLRAALCKYYHYEGDFTKENAAELSIEVDKELAVLRNASISDLEGLQYFTNLTTVYIGGNNLKSFKPLTELPVLLMLDISNNSIKGKTLEKAFNKMGRMERLEDITLDNNKLTNINFLGKIGNIKKYYSIEMVDNKISDISILKGATNLVMLEIRNNRITDVSSLKNLDNLTSYIDLRDNCIIDYSPIKHLFDKMYEDFDDENGMDRYDFYTNPVNFKYEGKKIKFPYLTVYYKYQAYAEAIPLFKAFGGSAEYNKKTGTLTCKYEGNIFVFKDYSSKYSFNGKEKSLEYPMRKMQYDLAYVPVKDICEILELNYNIVETRDFYLGNDRFVYAPKLVKISKNKKELG